MFLQKLGLRSAVAIIAFFIGCSVYSVYGYLQAALFSPAVAAAPTTPAGIDNAANAVAAENSIEDLSLLDNAQADRAWDPTGDYYIFDEKLLKGFHDVDFLEIATNVYAESGDSYTSTSIPPTGSLHAKRNYRFRTISLSKDFFTFETEVKRGVSYRFVGKIGGMEIEPTDRPLIEGQLTKVDHGVTSTMEAKFYIEVGC
jgi:hypothetical protein